ncbi:PAS domain S-box protein [Rossellomorea vietnamensis]|uniref:histidine kinase n=1 Tax=Rossellomorea vietnamensis TaxID=218284 RepID=A0A5D4ME84_9BACI|nr:ATP-binding protein [Rossellomorea vietnamensis]TYR99767.1 PAS domain S-box protein [Rossellomorea vietnamensis]
MSKLFDFSLVNDKSTDAKVILNSGSIVYANRAFMRLLGLQEEVIGENILTFFHHPFRELGLSHLFKIKNGEMSSFTQHKMARFDNQLVDVEVITAPFIHDGDILVQAVIRDLSSVKKNEELLRQSEKLSLVGELASGIVHEIRNPLTAMKGFLQLMRSYPQTEYIEIVLEELKQIEEITNELLYFSRPQEAHFSQLNIVDIVREAVNFSSAQAFKRNINIELETLETYIGITGSKTQLKQVLLNILINGTEAIKNNGRISIFIKKDSRNVYIYIRDNGSGISKDHLSKIGQPFFTSKEKGNGLGLMVSFNIIKKHNGAIHIDSEEGQGTTFMITLPLASEKALPHTP